MADSKSDKEQIPAPISREDSLLHNIIDGTPDIADLEPISREETYLKYIALNGGGGGGDVNIVQTTGQSTTSVMSQKAVTDNLTTKVDSVDGKGLSTEDFTTEYKEKLEGIPNDIGNLGSAAYCDIGINEGNVPILNHDGKLDNAVIPSLALSETYTADNEEEMLDLPGVEQGDICVRTDENKTYILNKPSVSRYRKKSLTNTSIDDWVELLTPTDEVISVNGKKGNVTITSEDVDTYTKDEINSKLPNIVQETGLSENDIMSQLSVTTELNKKISNMATAGGISIGKFTNNSYYQAISIGNNSEVLAEDNIAIGILSSAKNSNSIAIGKHSVTKGENSIAIGQGSITFENSNNSIGIGKDATVIGENSISLGFDSHTSDNNVLSIGSATSKRRIVNVNDPITKQDAATKNYVDLQIVEKVQKLTVLTEKMDIYISPSGSDSLGNGSKSLPYATVNKVLSLIGSKRIDTEITVYALEGTYNEEIIIENLSGSGSFRIFGDHANQNNTMTFNSCFVANNTLKSISINNINISSEIGTSPLFITQNTGFINFYDVEFSGLYIHTYSSNVSIDSCSFSNVTTAMNISNGIDVVGNNSYPSNVVLTGNNTFTNVTTAANVSNGGMLIITEATTLNGALLNKSSGGMIVYPNGIDPPNELYSSTTGTKENITLNDSSANYKYLEVYYYADQHHIMSSKICDPNGNSIVLTMVGYYGNSIVLRSSIYNISGTDFTLSTNDSGYASINNSSVTINGETNPFFVIKILGYK